MKPVACCLVVAAGWLGLAALAAAQAVVPAPAAPAAVQAPPASPASGSLPPSRWTPAQIRQSFEFADSDANGELTRAEAQHLTIMPRSFEEIDENKDGVISRAEYEALFAR